MSEHDPRDEFEEKDSGPPESGGEQEQAKTDNQGAEFYLRTMEELRKERDEHYNLLLRKQAEFENYRKRVNREKEDHRVAVTIELIQEILPVVDACEKGLTSLQAQQDPALSAYRDGYALLLKQLSGFLEKFNVTEVPGTGAAFDPNLHEAVQREITNQHEEGEILEEYRKGYRIGERLLRPSQVKVAVQPELEKGTRPS